MHKALLLAALLFTTALAGCASGDKEPEPTVTTPPKKPGSVTPVEVRETLEFNMTGSWSHVLERGPWGILPGVGHSITIDLPVGAGLPTAQVHMGLFFPDNGCDWSSLMDIDPAPEAAMVKLPAMDPSELDPCRAPVIADTGPYYGEGLLGDVHATEPANRLGRFLIENFVPHGYIVAQVSVTGTGDSTGCMDLMGPVEQASVQESTRYLGDAAFSNGAVALIGRSYDGSTPWEATMAPDLPQLKSVVPISGLFGQLSLMWKNGSVETRGPGVLWGLYYAFTYTGNEQNAPLQAQQIAENLVCTDTQTGGAIAAASYLYGGDPFPAEGFSYWQEREFKNAVLANYQGSVYFIHGMQDWNVDPHMAFPFYNELEQNGLEMKGLFGQWGHMYPDRVSEHSNNLRWDWAQDLLEWFNHYLKGTGDKPQLHVEMEDNQNQWRIEETWPAPDTRWDVIRPTGGTSSAPATCGVPQPTVSPTCTIVYALGALNQSGDYRIAGLPKFHVDVTPTGPGGQIYAELRDSTANRHLGHAIMDLRYHAGGDQLQAVVPGQTITAMMEFFPMDVVVPAGHEITLLLAGTGRDYLPSAVSSPVIIMGGDLKLPSVQRTADDLFLPPGWTPYSERDADN